MVTAAAPVMLPVMSTTPHARHALPARAACALRAARVERGLSLRETARRAGIGHGFLHAIEAGVKAPGRVRADTLLAVLDPPGWLATEVRDAAERVERGRAERAAVRELRRQGVRA
jgi:transcriptional regulator with XRE-family HTH domain